MDAGLRDLERKAVSSGSKEDAERYEAALKRSGLIQLWVVGFHKAYSRCLAKEPIKKGQFVSSNLTSGQLSHVYPTPPGPAPNYSLTGISLQDLETGEEGLYQSSVYDFRHCSKSLVGATDKEDAIRRAIKAWPKLTSMNCNGWYGELKEYVVDAVPFEPRLGWMHDVKYEDSLTRESGDRIKHNFKFNYKYALYDPDEEIVVGGKSLG